MFTASPFFNTPAQRLSLARERFFERGERPTGLVSEAVIQSWMRCLHQRMEPQRPVVFEPVTASRVQSVLRRNRHLLQAGAAELQQLQQALAGTPVAALLIDAQGVVMHSTWQQPRVDTPVMNIASRIGVNLSEAAVGTTAPGVAAHGAHTVTVEGGEHFAHVIHGMQCAAAPVRDARGRLVAVLDLSCEGRSFGFDAAQLVERYARGIENRLLCLQAPQQVVVRLQLDAALLHSPWAGLVGVDGNGQVDWLNAAAAALLGQPSHWSVPLGLAAEAVLGLSAAALHGACRAGPAAAAGAAQRADGLGPVPAQRRGRRGRCRRQQRRRAPARRARARRRTGPGRAGPAADAAGRRPPPGAAHAAGLRRQRVAGRAAAGRVTRAGVPAPQGRRRALISAPRAVTPAAGPRSSRPPPSAPRCCGTGTPARRAACVRRTARSRGTGASAR